MKTFKKVQQGFTLIELMIVVAIIGLLAALAIPKFLKFQARAKTSEAKTNLKGLYTAQKSYLAEHDAFAADLQSCGYEPERGNRYAMWMGDGATKIDRTAATGVQADGVAPTEVTVDLFKVGQTACSSSGGGDCLGGANATETYVLNGTEVAPLPGPKGGVDVATQHSFSAWAYGDIDSDTSVDGWFISNISATVPATSAACVPQTNAAEGSPTNVFNDVDC